MPWTPWIDVIADDDADETLRRLYERFRHPVTGAVPDTVRLVSLYPEVADALMRLNRGIHAHADGLSVKEREIAALVVSSANG